ncbi:MAG: hypothetical protein AAFR77_22340, partial [Cyanobacteria bacterium J06631_2]
KSFPTIQAHLTMPYPSKPSGEPCVTTFDEFVQLADYSLMDMALLSAPVLLGKIYVNSGLYKD